MATAREVPYGRGHDPGGSLPPLNRMKIPPAALALGLPAPAPALVFSTRNT